MATVGEIALLRRLTDEPDDNGKFSDLDLEARINDKGSPEAAAYGIWVEKAASYASLTSFSEGGSSRTLSDLYKNALAMAKHFSVYTVEDDPGSVRLPSSTSPISRA